MERPLLSPVHAWLWRRIPHPDSLVPGGPEIDFALQAKDLVLLGEAKWKSDVGKGQGVNRDTSQIELRREFCAKHGERLFGPCRFVVLGVGLETGIVPHADERVGGVSVHVRETVWERVCALPSLPNGDEVRRYLSWENGLANVNRRPGAGETTTLRVK